MVWSGHNRRPTEITKIIPFQLAYVFFLVMFTYTVLVKMEMTPNWQEVYSIVYITALGCEKIREIISSEPVAITYVLFTNRLIGF